MGTTSEFIKLRSSGKPKTGEWNINFKDAMNQAKNENKFIIVCWSNGDKCGYCTAAEKCMMDKVFTDWMKTADSYFVFKYSGDANKGKDVYDWCFSGTGVRYFPGFRVTLYDPKTTSKVAYEVAMDGNKLRGNKTGQDGAKQMVAKLTEILAKKPSGDTDAETADYKIRLNEKLTVAKVNKILDAIDANEGYCPCQAQSADTKCHCKDFIENKKIGKPCICNIYVKQKR